jgi:hypothetical protein
MALFQLIARLGLNTAGFETGLKRAESLTTRFGKSVAGSVKGQFAAAFGAAAIAQMTRNTIEYAGEIEDMSDRLGVSTDFIQEQAFALKMAGAEMQDLIPIMQQIAKTRAEALRDRTGDAAQAFGRLGITALDLQSMKLEQIYMKLGQAVKNAANSQIVLVDSLKVMGKSAGAVIPAMRAGLQGAAQDAHKLGQVMNPEVLEGLGQLGDEIDILGKQFQNTFGETLIFALRAAMTYFEYSWARIKQGFNFLAYASIGKTAPEALKYSQDMLNADMAALAARDADIRARRQARRNAANLPLHFDEPAFSKTTSTAISHPNVGSFSARPVDAMMQLRLMHRIAQSTERTATNTQQKPQVW